MNENEFENVIHVLEMEKASLESESFALQEAILLRVYDPEISVYQEVIKENKAQVDRLDFFVRELSFAMSQIDQSRESIEPEKDSKFEFALVILKKHLSKAKESLFTIKNDSTNFINGADDMHFKVVGRLNDKIGKFELAINLIKTLVGKNGNNKKSN